MEQWDTGLAKMFKERENKKVEGIVIGKVITGMPELSISIGSDIILDSDQLIVSNRLYHMLKHEIHIDITIVQGVEVKDTYYVPVPVPLVVGDLVILIPQTDGQVYFVIDKVGE
jgi:hypothetical protein